MWISTSAGSPQGSETAAVAEAVEKQVTRSRLREAVDKQPKLAASQSQSAMSIRAGDEGCCDALGAFFAFTQ